MLNLILTIAAVVYVSLACFTITMRKAKVQRETYFGDCVLDVIQLPFRALRFFLSNEFSGRRSVTSFYEHLCGPRVMTLRGMKTDARAWFAKVD